jgi:hypothetical protein
MWQDFGDLGRGFWVGGVGGAELFLQGTVEFPLLNFIANMGTPSFCCTTTVQSTQSYGTSYRLQSVFQYKTCSYRRDVYIKGKDVASLRRYPWVTAANRLQERETREKYRYNIHRRSLGTGLSHWFPTSGREGFDVVSREGFIKNQMICLTSICVSYLKL